MVTIGTRRRLRRGGMYIAVLAVATVVTVIGLSAILSVRVQGATGRLVSDAEIARLNAHAATELFAQFTKENSNWRSRAPGNWLSAQRLYGGGTCTLNVSDPIDADLANRPYDPVLLRATGVYGNATHICEVKLSPKGTPISSLGVALQAAGEVRVESSGLLTVNVGPVSSNSTIRVDGKVVGRGECTAAVMTGSVTGGVALLSPVKAMPPSNVLSTYTALGTVITTTTNINRKVLAPGVNTIGGGVNADGVYILNSGQDVNITNFRLLGTLIINAPGKTVTISGQVLMQPARPDYPVLIVNGMLTLQTDPTSQLAESSLGTNFNPTGAVYNGVTDSDTSDSYPCDIKGLVHATDQVVLQGKTHITGALICDSTKGSKAVDIDGTPTIDYDPGLFTLPPMMYTASVQLKVSPGSWTRVVLP